MPDYLLKQIGLLTRISHETVSVGDTSPEKRVLGLKETPGMAAHPKIEAQGSLVAARWPLEPARFGSQARFLHGPASGPVTFGFDTDRPRLTT